jgi:predicted permease
MGNEEDEEMSWSRLKRRIRIVLNKDDVEQELDEELRAHVEMETTHLVRGGMPEAEARREALRRFGGVERTKEQVRDERGGRLLEDLLQDLRYGVRSLRRSPGFTFSALLVLALGIGSAVTLFAAVDAVLLEPLPYPDSERLVRVWPSAPGRGIEQGAFSYPDVLDWRVRVGSLDRMATYSTLAGDYVYLGDDGPVELSTQWVAGDFFETLGVPPTLGRTLAQTDAEAKSAVTVISHGLWQRLFGGEGSAVGSTIVLDYRSFEIVGVMPAGFAYPAGEDTEVWVPLTVIPEDDIPISVRQVRFLQAFGRLAPGVSEEAARQDMAQVAASLAETYPDSNAGVTSASLLSMRDWMVGDVRRSLWVALGAVGLILLLACATVANLLLARGTARAREVALRMSLGAPSQRIVRQLLTESLLLSLSGGLAGVLLAWAATAVLAGRAGTLLPRGVNIGLDGTVLGVAVLVALAVTAMAGMLPAIKAADVAPGWNLRGRGSSGGPSALRLRRTLVVTEVTLAVLLLSGAGLLGRSLAELSRVDPGFESEGRIAMTLTIADQKYPERAQWLGLYHGILERLAEHPDVRSAGAIRYLPFRGDGEALPVRVAGLYAPTPDEQRYAHMFQLSPGLLDALGMRLLRGRGITAADGPGDPLAAVVNEAFQSDFFQGEDPVGRRFDLAGTGQSVEIVGVVHDMRYQGLAERPAPAVYINNDQVPRIQMSYVVHTSEDPLAMIAEMRRMVREVDADQAISEILALDELAAEHLARPRFFASLLSGFAFMALVLAALGVYGVLSYMVRSQVRETGLRLALGASAPRIAARVVGQGMQPVLGGLALGLLGSMVLTRFLGVLLFGVEPLDAPTFGAVIVLLGGVAAVACLVPARYASRVDPMVSIRAE